jgi:hypothetical protein
MDSNGIGSLCEKHAIVADAQSHEAFELSGQRANLTDSGFRVTMNRFENRQYDALWDGPHLSLYSRLQSNPLHRFG